jgi:hypothetical protein
MVARRQKDDKPTTQRRYHLLPLPFTRLVQRIAKYIMPSSSSIPKSLELGKMRVSAWLKEASKDSGVLSGYMLKQLEVWKGDGGVKHELIVASFESGKSIVWVATERCANPDPENPRRSGYLQSNASAGSIPLSAGGSDTVSMVSGAERESSTSLTRYLDAEDSIWVNPTVSTASDMVRHISKIRERKTAYISVGCITTSTSTSTIDDKPCPTMPIPTILNFADAASSSSRVEPRYSLTTSNCYWFTGAILYILAVKFPHLTFKNNDIKDTEHGHFMLLSGVFDMELGEVTEDQKTLLINEFESLVSHENSMIVISLINCLNC